MKTVFFASFLALNVSYLSIKMKTVIFFSWFECEFFGGFALLDVPRILQNILF